MASDKPEPFEDDDTRATANHLRLVHVNETAPSGSAELAAEAAFFRRCGFSKPAISEALSAARRNGTDVETELIAAGLIAPDIYYRWLAEQLDLPYFSEIAPQTVIAIRGEDAVLRRTGPLRVARGDTVVTVIVPKAARLAAEQKRLATLPQLRARLAVASPGTIRRAVWAAGAEERCRRRTQALFETRPHASARRVLTGTQGYLLAGLKSAFLASLILWPYAALTGLHIVLSFFFLAANGLRLVAALFGRRPARPELPPGLPAELPVYTLLIALKDEVAIVPQLLAGLDRLRWPKSRLDIKFICEADDAATIAALEAHGLGAHQEVVRVPAYGPKTKPKALQYALAGARGEFVAVYDAEDVPAPAQLLESWSIFSRSGPDLACVQAPLAIANIRRNWITALFAIEYAGLFRALVPFLDRFGLPIPLGGTSNHFRKAALEDVGGWDPYNVTEDADLGFRLFRAGYRTHAAFHATIETAPAELDIWVNQRSRWLKGWTQTWLVLMRRPIGAIREFGLKGFITVQVLIGGMLVSTLAHPVMYAFIGYFLFQWLSGGRAEDTVHRTLFALDIVNVLGSYVTFAFLGLAHMTRAERRRIPFRRVALLPVYWLMMSKAAWRAIAELWGRPHMWAKTPHPVGVPRQPADPGGN